jgi:hypothetical protein
VLGVIGHRDRLVNEQYRDAVLDAVCAAKPRVVQKLVVDQQQRPTIFRTDEDAQQFFVDHGRGLADSEDNARVLARLGWHARRRLADAEAVPRLLLPGVGVLLKCLQLALVGQRRL